MENNIDYKNNVSIIFTSETKLMPIHNLPVIDFLIIQGKIIDAEKGESKIININCSRLLKEQQHLLRNGYHISGDICIENCNGLTTFYLLKINKLE